MVHRRCRGKVGTPFTATVHAPLRDRSGQTLVAHGAKVHGRLVSYGAPGQAHVQVALDSIDTVAGPAPLFAAIRKAEMALPQEVRVPGGAVVELQLTDPIAVPASSARVASGPERRPSPGVAPAVAPGAEAVRGTFSVHVVRVTDPALQAQLERLRSDANVQLTYAPAVVVAIEPAEQGR